MTRYLSRKFILAMTLAVMTAGLCFLDKVDGGVYMSVVIAVIGIYSGANVMQKKIAPEAKDAATPQT